MAWVAPRTWVVGEVLTAGNLNTHLRDNFNALGDAWTTYVPVWTTTGTAPTLSNATLTGRSITVGKTRWVRIYFSFGSGSAAGTGEWMMTLPAGNTPNDATDQSLHGHIEDASTANRYVIAGMIDPNTAQIIRMPMGDLGISGVDNTRPITWATDDVLVLQGIYELA